ncbi:iron-sulfur cluster assembly protein [Achlya hypogyna]|uniref:Iron-sulfur cluster assembly protein n=1 Tax=Achlya hypogyna TaxID=1202772 RepID=A0A1V9ZG82_ACHHY|nr:iron-sulfur cluster assembly protein [Achlya hypogyna]
MLVAVARGLRRAARPARRHFSDLNLPDIIITRGAVQQLNKINATADPKQYLRVAVEGGGCSGFQYVLTLEHDTLEEDDQTFEKDGAQVVVDATSMEFLKGSTVDFVQELIRSSFSVINNPNAVSGCGCGTSFELKD